MRRQGGEGTLAAIRLLMAQLVGIRFWNRDNSMRVFQKFSHVMLAGAVVLLAAEAAMADVCDVSERLEANGKVLPSSLSVSKRDRAFIERYGLRLRKGLFGATYVREGDLMNWFVANGCDDALVAWALKKGRAEKRERSEDSASSGGRGDSGGN